MMQIMIKVPSLYSLPALNSAWNIHELQEVEHVLFSHFKPFLLPREYT